MVNSSWRDSKDEKKQQAYWESAKEYSFDMNTGERLELYALDKKEAIKRAKSHERWLHKKGYKKDKILINTIKEKKY